MKSKPSTSHGPTQKGVVLKQSIVEKEHQAEELTDSLKIFTNPEQENRIEWNWPFRGEWFPCHLCILTTLILIGCVVYLLNVQGEIS